MPDPRSHKSGVALAIVVFCGLAAWYASGAPRVEVPAAVETRENSDRPAPALEHELAALAPGMTQGLHEHEWREHGGCSGLDDDEYFRGMRVPARALDAALAASLTTLAGRETAAADRHREDLGGARFRIAEAR